MVISYCKDQSIQGQSKWSTKTYKFKDNHLFKKLNLAVKIVRVGIY